MGKITDLTPLVHRWGVRWSFGVREKYAEFLVGTVRHCQCYEEGVQHLLRHSADPERLVPICGAGDSHWTHDNQSADISHVTCARCLRMIEGLEVPTEGSFT